MSLLMAVPEMRLAGGGEGGGADAAADMMVRVKRVLGRVFLAIDDARVMGRRRCVVDWSADDIDIAERSRKGKLESLMLKTAVGGAKAVWVR